MRKYITVFAASAMALITSTAGCASSQIATDKIGVIVSLLPQMEFAGAVGGDKVELTVMVPPGADPHTYEVTPAQIFKLSRAKLYCKVGSPVEFELVWMDKIKSANKSMLIADCSSGIELVKSQDPNEPGMDPHIWLSVSNARIMVQNICSALVQIDPSNKDFYEKNRDSYHAKLTALDQEIKTALAGMRNRSFIVFHPSFGYFARDYNLTQIGIEHEGKEPTTAYISRVIAEVKNKNIKVVFSSPQFDKRSAEVIAREIGGRVNSIDALAEHYIDNMRAIKAALQQAMQ